MYTYIYIYPSPNYIYIISIQLKSKYTLSHINIITPQGSSGEFIYTKG